MAQERSRPTARAVRTLLALVALSVPGAVLAQGIRATVDGDYVLFPDVQPTMSNGRVMVPVRGVFEHMDAAVTWDKANQTVVATRGTDTISLPIGKTTATVNGRSVYLDAPAVITTGRAMVPLRFLSEALGASVEWIEAVRIVEIKSASANGTHVTTSSQEALSMVSAPTTVALTAKQLELHDAMRTLWSQHVSWTRQFIVSATGSLGNKSVTTARLLQNQEDIGNAMKPIYGDSVGENLTSLLKTHIAIASDVVTAMKSQDSRRTADKKQDWYRNSDEIADALYNANSRNLSKDEMRQMMREHLDLTFEEAQAELEGDYATSVRRYDQVQEQAMMLADMLSEGIVRQYPAIYPGGNNGGPDDGEVYTNESMSTGTVIPFTLVERLNSSNAAVGDRFTARVDAGDQTHYQGLPAGALLEGHVDVVNAKSGNDPGVLGLKFDRVRMPNGQYFRINGALIGLDKDSVTNDNGRLVAKDGAKSNDLKYVGYGAGAGALVAILTKGNVITHSLLGAALGYLYGEIQKDPSKARNVVLDSGTKFGVRLTDEFAFRALAKA